MFLLKDLPTRDILEAYRDRFPEMDVAATERALALLRDASRLLRRIEAYFTEHGLSQTRFLILILLDREPGRDGLSLTALADKLDVSKPVVTTTVKALAGEGLLEVSGDAQDRRGKRLRLTDMGRARLHALLPGYYQVINDFMAD